jgi:hypothetical protein
MNGGFADPQDPALRVVEEDAVEKPVMVIESRPSQFTGVGYWLVMAYQDKQFEELLPADFMGLTPEKRDEITAPLAEKLRVQMAKVLDSEDRIEDAKEYERMEMDDHEEDDGA